MKVSAARLTDEVFFRSALGLHLYMDCSPSRGQKKYKIFRPAVSRCWPLFMRRDKAHSFYLWPEFLKPVDFLLEIGYHNSVKECTLHYCRDKDLVPRGTGAILCMRPELAAIDSKAYIVPIWMI